MPTIYLYYRRRLIYSNIGSLLSILIIIYRGYSVEDDRDRSRDLY